MVRGGELVVNLHADFSPTIWVRFFLFKIYYCNLGIDLNQDLRVTIVPPDICSHPHTTM